MANTLTRRQREVLNVVLEFFTIRGRLPTVRELAQELGFGSTSTAYSHLQALKRNGALRDDNGHIALAPATLQTLSQALRDKASI
jgi:SOS-response transcriptional repressor LexA